MYYLFSLTDVMYAGTGAVITETQLYTGSFSCRFDVFLYPLDQQICSVELAMNIGEPTDVLIVYNGDYFLQQFEVTNFSSTTNFETEPKIIKVLSRTQHAFR